MKLKYRLDRLEKSRSNNNDGFLYTENDWTDEDWDALIMNFPDEKLLEKHRLTKWPKRKLEDYFK